jgi:hypothetical protein
MFFFVTEAKKLKKESFLSGTFTNPISSNEIDEEKLLQDMEELEASNGYQLPVGIDGNFFRKNTDEELSYRFHRYWSYYFTSLTCLAGLTCLICLNCFTCLK